MRYRKFQRNIGSVIEIWTCQRDRGSARVRYRKRQRDTGSVREI